MYKKVSRTGRMYEKVYEISKIFPNGAFCKEKFGDCKVLSTKALLNADFIPISNIYVTNLIPIGINSCLHAA